MARIEQTSCEISERRSTDDARDGEGCGTGGGGRKARDRLNN